MIDPKRVPELLVEKLAMGELPADQAKQVRLRLEAEPGGLERLAAIEQSNREILNDYPVRPIAAAIRQKAEEQKEHKFNWSSMPLAAIAAALIVITAALVLWPSLRSAEQFDPRVQPITDRIKGDARLFIHLKTDAGSRELVSGEIAEAGALLQISYDAGNEDYGAIASVDGRGNITLHFPARPDGSTKLTTGGLQSLPFAYELDDAPRFERFVFVSANEPFNAGLLINALKAVGDSPDTDLKLPKNLSVTELTLLKAKRSN